MIAPDLPGFGFTTVPAERKYKYSFDALAKTILARLADTRFETGAVCALAVFDYSAPTVLRVCNGAGRHARDGDVSQNGNAYERRVWRDAVAPISVNIGRIPSAENREKQSVKVSLDCRRTFCIGKYVVGAPDENARSRLWLSLDGGDD